MKKRISKKELIAFNRTLSLMLLSRLGIAQSLEIFINQTKNESLKSIVKQILSDIKSGLSLSKSFSKHPQLFSPVYIANLKVGEETGTIANVISEYTDYMEQIQDLKKDIVKAGRYPLLVLLVAGGVIIFMVFFLIPTFQSLFTSTNLNLPAVTRVILNISHFISENLLHIFILIVSLILVFLKFRKTDSFRFIIDNLLIKLPLISTLYTKNLLARFSLSMSILLKSKITLLEAMKISKHISPNTQFKLEIDRMIKKMIKGESMASNISTSVFFDLTFSRLLSAGEESAELEKVFEMISNYYSKEFDHHLDAATSLIEPILILFIGVIVALILVAMYLPMFELINNFGV